MARPPPPPRSPYRRCRRARPRGKAGPAGTQGPGLSRPRGPAAWRDRCHCPPGRGSARWPAGRTKGPGRLCRFLAGPAGQTARPGHLAPAVAATPSPHATRAGHPRHAAPTRPVSPAGLRPLVLTPHTRQVARIGGPDPSPGGDLGVSLPLVCSRAAPPGDSWSRLAGRVTWAGVGILRVPHGGPPCRADSELLGKE